MFRNRANTKSEFSETKAKMSFRNRNQVSRAFRAKLLPKSIHSRTKPTEIELWTIPYLIHGSYCAVSAQIHVAYSVPLPPTPATPADLLAAIAGVRGLASIPAPDGRPRRGRTAAGGATGESSCGRGDGRRTRETLALGGFEKLITV